MCQLGFQCVSQIEESEVLYSLRPRMGKLFCMFSSKRFENILGKMATNSGSIVLHLSKQRVCTYSDVGGCFLFVVELLNEHWNTKDAYYYI